MNDASATVTRWEFDVQCPICNAPAPMSEDAPGWGSWHRCPTCELEFVEPMRLRQDPLSLYDGAYRGDHQESRMGEFNDRIAIREALREEPELWFWTPAFYRVLDWLEHRYGQGAVVLELGCGLGFFLHAARKRGFDICGLDVALRAVELNREDGFRVWHGTLDSMPPDWVSPDAIVCFFMLHHLEDPVGFFRSIREKWPHAGLAVGQYGPSNRDVLSSTPPRTLTKWNSTSLAGALQTVGYEVSINEFASSATERGAMRPVRKILKRTLAMPHIYRALRRVEHRFLRSALASKGKPSYVVLAIAEGKRT